MMQAHSELLNTIIQRKLRPIEIILTKDGMLEQDYGALWFMPTIDLKRGDLIHEHCAFFYGLDLTTAMHLPIIELTENLAIEIDIIPERDRTHVIIMDSTATLNSLRLQQQLANEVKLANGKLEKLGRTDALTGLNNRGYWETQLQKEFERCKRYGDRSTLVMLDIDHFKKINDQFGHPAGDKVIRSLAHIIRTEIREIDIAGRYGGEEFGLILPETSVENGYILVERLRERCATELIDLAEDQTTNFTISIGLAQVSKTHCSATAWISAADEALYEAKRNGRNQSVVL